jgi:hypothetical protein
MHKGENFAVALLASGLIIAAELYSKQPISAWDVMAMMNFFCIVAFNTSDFVEGNSIKQILHIIPVLLFGVLRLCSFWHEGRPYLGVRLILLIIFFGLNEKSKRTLQEQWKRLHPEYEEPKGEFESEEEYKVRWMCQVARNQRKRTKDLRKEHLVKFNEFRKTDAWAPWCFLSESLALLSLFY